MFDSLSFAESLPPRFINWFMPVWLTGAGVLLGILLLAVLGGVCFVLSRVPAVGRLAECPQRRRVAMAILAVLFFAGAIGSLWGSELLSGSGQDLLTQVGVIAGLCWFTALSSVYLVSRRAMGELLPALREGVLFPISVIALCLATVGIIGVLLVREPGNILASLIDLPYAGQQTPVDETIPAPTEGDELSEPEAVEVALPFTVHIDKVQQLTLESDQRLVLSFTPPEVKQGYYAINVSRDEPYIWLPGSSVNSPMVSVDYLYVRNYSEEDATLTIKLTTKPMHPEVRTILITAIGVVVLFSLYLVQRAAAPRLSAVALATVKSEMNQPLYLIMLALGVFAMVAFIFFPYHTFGEDIKVLKDSGLKLIMVMAIISAVWAASSSVADEIEGRTALTVLSKPIGRRSFIIGKFVGINWTTVLMFVVLGLVLMAAVAYKPIYDAREASQDPDEVATWQVCYTEMASTVPGLVLAFLATVVLTGISVAISTRLPLMANFVICFAIYVLGHLTPTIVQSSLGRFEVVRFVGQLIATVLPNLELLNSEAAIAADKAIPASYLGLAFAYCMIYTVVSILLSLLLFEDRDVA
jgi:hypothetical protein